MVIVNETVEKKNSTKLIEDLKNAGLTSIIEKINYLTKLISAKEEKAQVGYVAVFLSKRVSNKISLKFPFMEITFLTVHETANELFSDSRNNVTVSE